MIEQEQELTRAGRSRGRHSAEGPGGPPGRLRAPVIDRLTLTRWVLVACQAATILVTWRLWGVRESPPMLPLLNFSAVAVGLPLLASLVLVLRFPLAGSVLHAVVLAYALVIDQTRMQPEVMSMALLLIAVSGREWLLFIGRVHLVTLWGWAGFAKLISTDFMAETGGWMFDGLFFQAPSGLRPYFGATVIFLEMGAGVLAIFRDLRVFSAALAVMVHLGALLVLGPLGRNWNSAIWPWNVALVVCAVALIAPWKAGWKSEFRSVPLAVRRLAIVLIVYPVLFYFGQADAYATHHLYSTDTSRGYVCAANGQCFTEPFRATTEELNVPFPPEHRLYHAFFVQTCRPGEILRIVDRRKGPKQPVDPQPCPRKD